MLLTWQDNAGDEACQAVQRKSPGDGEWEGRLFLSAGDDSADDRVFEALGQYCYRVLAANERGASVSNETCVQVPEVTVREGLPPGAPPPSYPTLPPGVGPSPTPPGPGPENPDRCPNEFAEAADASVPAPSALAARWGPLRDNPAASGVLLEWRSTGVDEGCSAVQRRGPLSAEWGTVSLGSATATSTDDRNFVAPGEYCYRVFAGRQGGSRSDYSNEVCLDVPQATMREGLPPGAPPPSYPTLPPGVGPSPAAPPASGSGSGPTAGPTLPLWLAGLAVAVALATAAVATWQIAAARRRR